MLCLSSYVSIFAGDVQVVSGTGLPFFESGNLMKKTRTSRMSLSNESHNSSIRKVIPSGLATQGLAWLDIASDKKMARDGAVCIRSQQEKNTLD